MTEDEIKPLWRMAVGSDFCEIDFVTRTGDEVCTVSHMSKNGNAAHFHCVWTRDGVTHIKVGETEIDLCAMYRRVPPKTLKMIGLVR